MGIAQALQSRKLYRAFDYLSTVSGGGYLGAYLSTWFVRNSAAAKSGEFPLPGEEVHTDEGRGLRNMIHGGDYIVDSSSALNKYLIGLVLNIAAVITSMLFVCCFVATLWRVLDYPYFRDRLWLLGYDSDILVPFLPALFLSNCWLISWMLAYYRKGNFASGNAAERLLLGSVIFFLIAVALLLGNGDVRMPWDSEFDDPIAVSDRLWMPFVFVIAVVTLLIPVIRPQRLLRSALAPRNIVDKWAFGTFSTAVLYGIPLVFVGFFGRENFSGCFTFSERGVHESEIKSARFTAEIFRQTIDGATEQSFDPVDYLAALVPQSQEGLDSLTDDVPVVSSGMPQSKATTPEQKSRARSGRGGPPIDPPLPAEPRVFDPVQFDSVETTKSVFSDYWTASGGLTPKNTLPEGINLFPNGQRDTRRAAEYLQFLALRIVRASREEAAAYHALVRITTESKPHIPLRLGESRWQTIGIDDHLSRLFSGLMYLAFGENNEAGRYWTARESHKALRSQFAELLSYTLLTSTSFTDRLSDVIDYRLKYADDLSYSASEIASLRSLQQRIPRLTIAAPHRMEAISLNRELLLALYPEILIPGTQVQRRVVIENDQRARCYTMLILGLIAVAVGWLLDINMTSMHRYYRTRLGRAFVVPKADGSTPSLHDLQTTTVGAPYHLFNTCVSRFGECRSSRMQEQTLARVAQTAKWDARQEDIFLLSPEYVGSEATGGYIATTDYHNLTRNRCESLNLANVIALSGAAVSPAQNNNDLLALLMFTLNLRLGQWMPNPLWPHAFTRPRFLYMLVATVWRSRERRPYVFISDGGHAENLGLVQLLRRRCRLIVVVDAGHDPRHEFADLANALRQAKIYYGIRCTELVEQKSGDERDREWSLDSLKLSNDNDSDASLLAAALEATGARSKPLRTFNHFSAARILYPKTDSLSSSEGLLILVKPTVTGDESLDVLQYQTSSPAFPQEPTSELVFSPAQVESYRALGYHIGRQLCDLLNLKPDNAQVAAENPDYGMSLSPKTLMKAFESNYFREREAKAKAKAQAKGKAPAKAEAEAQAQAKA
jgi:hypothetical protein